MTAKEKAKELFDNFGNHVDDCSYTSNYSKENAKMCVLIAVDEIMLALSNNYRQNQMFIRYYEQVKLEIEKL